MVLIMNSVIKYSKTKKIFKIVPSKVDTVIFDEIKSYKYVYGRYNGMFEHEGNSYSNMENLIIDNKFHNICLDIGSTKAKNIYFKNEQNLGGITIPYNLIKRNKLRIQFSWRKQYKSNIAKINFVFDEKTVPLNLEEVKEIYIESNNNVLRIEIKGNTWYREYTIDESRNIKKVASHYRITENDIKDNILDLRNYLNYEQLLLEQLKIDTLIINKHYIKKIKNLLNINKQLHRKTLNFNKLRIIDDSDMKLMPYDETFIIDDYIGFYENPNYIHIKNEDNQVLIFLDKNDEIKVLDRHKIKNQKDVEDVIFRGLPENPLILIKYKKKDKYQVIDFNATYNITKLFTKFVLGNINTRVGRNTETALNYFQNNDWVSIFSKVNISSDGFHIIYEDYLKYKEHLKKLLKLGFSYKALMYLHDRKCNAITKINGDNDLNLDNITQDEVLCYNELGKKYIKSKRKNNYG